MPNDLERNGAIANRFLLALPPATLKRIEPALEPVSLAPGTNIFRMAAPVRRLYFINRGFVSIVKTMQDGRTVEIGTHGDGDIVGLFSLYGIEQAAWDSVVQVPGTAMRLNTDTLRAEADGDSELRDLLERYTFHVLSGMAQTAACHRLHSLKQRFCRWLLAAQDSAHTDTLPLTHEALALMLGVQRSGVSLIAGAFQKAGAIRNGRGSIRVLDRSLLEAEACECHLATQADLVRVFNGAKPGGPD